MKNEYKVSAEGEWKEMSKVNNRKMKMKMKKVTGGKGRSKICQRMKVKKEETRCQKMTN